MAYIQLNELEDLTAAMSTANDEYLLVSKNLTSYKLNITTLKEILFNLYSSESDELFNKILTSPNNLVHANSLQHSVIASEDLNRGDLITVKSINNVSKAVKCDGSELANGVVKYDVSEGDLCTFIFSGLFDNYDGDQEFDTSNFNVGDVLYQSDNGEITNIRPTSTLEQNIGVVVESDETFGSIVLNNVFFEQEKAKDIYFDSSTSNATQNNVQGALKEVWDTLQVKIINTNRLLISANKIVLPALPIGEVIGGSAMVFDDVLTNVYDVYTCDLDSDIRNVVFDINDELNGKYAQISYMCLFND